MGIRRRKVYSDWVDLKKDVEFVEEPVRHVTRLLVILVIWVAVVGFVGYLLIRR